MTPELHSDPKLEIAHVLTMDVVEYLTLLITEQTRIMAELTPGSASHVRPNNCKRNQQCNRLREVFQPMHDAVIRIYDEAGNVIETHEHAGEFKEW
jgi:hypothetical protein